MADRPELPEQFRSGRSVVDVFPDVRPMRWTIWDLEGCIGEISWDDDEWHSHPESEGVRAGEHDAEHATWQAAVDAVIAG